MAVGSVLSRNTQGTPAQQTNSPRRRRRHLQTTQTLKISEIPKIPKIPAIAEVWSKIFNAGLRVRWRCKGANQNNAPGTPLI